MKIIFSTYPTTQRPLAQNRANALADILQIPLRLQNEGGYTRVETEELNTSEWKSLRKKLAKANIPFVEKKEDENNEREI